MGYASSRKAARRFNPTLVRLRRERATQGWQWHPWFQSHAGSIEAPPQQFGGEWVDLGFNPTLVRLRPWAVRYPFSTSFLFQSHAGSIEASYEEFLEPRNTEGFNPTLVRLRPPPMRHPLVDGGISFNPTLVRLRPILRWQKEVMMNEVSIPRWFD